MENIADKPILPVLEAHPGATFARKNTVFETVKSTALGFSAAAALLYTSIQLIKSLRAESLLLRPGRTGLAISAGIGAGIGAYWGADKLIRTQIYNNRADTLNRHANNPKIMSDILMQGGDPAGFIYRRNGLETSLSMLNNGSLLGWLVTAAVAPGNKLASYLLGTSILSAAGYYASHLVGINHAASMDRKNLSHIEALAVARQNAAQTQPIRA